MMLHKTLLRCLGILALVIVAGATIQAATTHADQSYATARQMYDTGNDKLAVGELQTFLDTYPDDPRVPDAAYMLGHSFERQQQYDQALKAYAQVIAKGTSPKQATLRAETHFRMGECWWKKADYEHAQRAYGYCQHLSGDDKELGVQASYWMGESLYKLGRYLDAQQAYAKVVELDPAHPLATWALYSQGMAALQQRNYAQTIAALEQLFAQHPNSPVTNDATLALGLAYAGRAHANTGTDQANDLKKTVDTLSPLFTNEKANQSLRSQAGLAMAQAYSDLKDYDKTAATLASTVALLPAGGTQAIEAQLLLGNALYNGERYSEAAGEYTKVAAQQQSPDAAHQALYWLGFSQYQQALHSKLPADYVAAVASFHHFVETAGQDDQLAPRAALFQAFALEDLAASGDTSARDKAVVAFKVVVEQWPVSDEASQAHAGITRLTSTMSSTELEKIVGLLPEGAPSWNVALHLAQSDFSDGKYTDTITAAKKVLASKPSGDLAAQAAYLVAASCQRLGRSADAIPYYKQVVSAGQSGEMAMYARRGLAWAYLDCHRFADACDVARALVDMPLTTSAPTTTREQELAERLALLAQAYQGNGQIATARTTYQRMVDEAPSSSLTPNALMSLAWIADTTKDYTTAIAGYQAFITKCPDHALVPEAFFRLGVDLSEQKEYDKAIDALKNVPASHKLADQAAYAIAWAYQDQGKSDEAVAEFTHLADTYPKSPLAADSLFRIGESCLEHKQYADAAKAYQHSLELTGQGRQATLVAYKLGVSALMAQKNDVAARAFDRVVLTDPESEFRPDCLYWKGQALERQGPTQAKATRAAYQQYLVNYPAGPLALDAALGAGRASLADKQYAQTRDDLQKALDLCDQLGQTTGAGLSDRAKNVAPEAQYWLGQADFEERKYDSAIKHFAAVAAYAYEPWYSRSMLQMARCSALNGDRDAAKRTLQLLQQYFPQSEAAAQVTQTAAEYNIDLKAGE